MRSRGELGDGDDDVGDVFGEEHLGAALGADGLRAVFENWRIDFAGKNGCDADVAIRFLVGDARAEGGDSEFGSVVGHTADGGGSFAGNRRDIDDHSVFPRPHLRQHGVHGVVNAGGVDCQNAVPVGRRHVRHEAVFEIHAGGVNENVDLTQLLTRPRK